MLLEFIRSVQAIHAVVPRVGNTLIASHVGGVIVIRCSKVYAWKQRWGNSPAIASRLNDRRRRDTRGNKHVDTACEYPSRLNDRRCRDRNSADPSENTQETSENTTATTVGNKCRPDEDVSKNHRNQNRSLFLYTVHRWWLWRFVPVVVVVAVDRCPRKHRGVPCACLDDRWPQPCESCPPWTPS